MAREVRLIRSITAAAGGYPGDGADFSESNQPAQASPHETQTDPIFFIPLRRLDDETVTCRGLAGMMRVTGADAGRRFTLRIFIEWLRKVPGGTPVRDWRLVTGAPTRDIGNGEDFTTDPVSLQDQNIAFHLVPVSGNLAAGSVVEIWGAEI